jgi:hypothetical protein
MTEPEGETAPCTTDDGWAPLDALFDIAAKEFAVPREAVVAPLKAALRLGRITIRQCVDPPGTGYGEGEYGGGDYGESDGPGISYEVLQPQRVAAFGRWEWDPLIRVFEAHGDSDRSAEWVEILDLYASLDDAAAVLRAARTKMPVAEKREALKRHERDIEAFIGVRIDEHRRGERPLRSCAVERAEFRKANPEAGEQQKLFRSLFDRLTEAAGVRPVVGRPRKAGARQVPKN